LQGHYDIIGFDPRGVNGSRPSVSCFDSVEDELAFFVQHETFYLNLPSNLTLLDDERVEWDLRRQVVDFKVAVDSLAGKCQRKIGDALRFMGACGFLFQMSQNLYDVGTEAVVRDIDFLAKQLDGENAPINFWGYSYGTLIGQQMLQILPPSRIGRLILDGVVSAPIWSTYADVGYAKKGFGSNNDVLVAFTQQCAASPSCALASFKSSKAILDRIDQEINKLYFHPRAVPEASYAAVLTASHLRIYIFSQLYSRAKWPAFASVLNATFHGDYVPLAEVAKIRMEPSNELGLSKVRLTSIWTQGKAC
jgi:pimeloyl-ACP methyl ester carboxylesterase